MAAEGTFHISLDHDSRRDPPDSYKVTLVPDGEPSRELLIRKFENEYQLREFLSWEADYDNSVVRQVITDVRHGMEVAISRKAPNSSSVDMTRPVEACVSVTAASPEPSFAGAPPEAQKGYAAAENSISVQSLPAAAGQAVLPAPQTAEETGISTALLEDLTIKLLFTQGEQLLSNLARHLGLSFAIVNQIFERLRKEQFVEVKGMTGLAYRTALTDRGRARALEVLSLSKYVGRAPVSLKDYTSRVQAQSVTNADVRPSGLQRALAHLVVDAPTVKRLGAAVVSGTSILLYGPSGTGKTSIAEVLPSVYGDSVWIPYAIEVAGQIVTVYDRGIHQSVEDATAGIMDDDSDGRWIRCRRPRVIVGGELTPSMLDVFFDPVAKIYSAPIQMKANNGVLVVDDFGRQLVRPENLLNRWIVPLDRGIDFLNMGGGKFEIPFDQFLVFASNLDPAELGDEAFLRRLTNKIKIDYIPSDHFHEIFRRQCSKFSLVYDADVVNYAIKTLAEVYNEPLRACQPRDIVRQISWAARYEGYPPKLDRESIAEACRNHFDHGAGALAGLAGSARENNDAIIARRKNRDFGTETPTSN